MARHDANLDVRSNAPRVRIGPLLLLRLTRLGAVDLIKSAVLLRQQMDIAFCNAHTMLNAFEDPGYADDLNRMVLLNDGRGADIAAHVLDGEPFSDNLNGTDFIPALLAEIGMPLRIYLLGGTDDAVNGAKDAILNRYPMHQIVGCRNGFFSEEMTDQICADVSAAQPDILLVAMGNPKQERFIVQNREKLSATVAIGVGALFDFLSGRAVRAPRAMRAAGLEWLFRLLLEPRRLSRRYLIGIPKFLSHIYRLRNEQKTGAN